jgi:orotate phosphoribosyltransferase
LSYGTVENDGSFPSDEANDPMTDLRLARAVGERAHITGTFLLRSGQTATDYFDKYRFEADPKLLRQIAEELSKIVPPDIEVLAGLELGGVPIATMLSQITGLPTAFVRKKAKEYGTCQLAEGAEVEGRRTLIVEDVVTSGGQIVLSAADLRGIGAVVDRAVCVVDREQGGAEKLREAGIELLPLFRRSELLE